MVASFANTPAIDVVAASVIEAVANGASVPSAQVAPAQVPWLGIADTNVNSGGNRSVSATLVAFAGPAFRIVIVKVAALPEMTGRGLSVCSTERSASVGAATSVISCSRPFCDVKSGVGDETTPRFVITLPGTRSGDICTVNLNSSDAPGGRTGVRHDTRLAVPGGGTVHVVGDGGTVPPMMTPPAARTVLESTLSAVPGPRFVTVPTRSMTPPGATTVEAASVSARSARSGSTRVDTEAELLAGAGSDSAALTVAVLTKVTGPE